MELAQAPEVGARDGGSCLDLHSRQIVRAALQYDVDLDAVFVAEMQLGGLDEAAQPVAVPRRQRHEAGIESWLGHVG